eukprot:TRINITY_DN30843_c0_g1_i1.p1 TRINITY_DN30843_c0_g1~~TRINITY_DN30843_c0_g1_i1.p1  ORF type:complete len:347 (+),score=63.62 TRINITY_DN30843_c0_g1_i1:63-1103(+)
MHPVSLGTTVAGLALGGCVFNSANPFATEEADLTKIARSAAAAVTTRTSLIGGFAHDDSQHTMAFHRHGSINCYGYSSRTFAQYLSLIPAVRRASFSAAPSNTSAPPKPIFVSITGSPDEIGEMLSMAESIPDLRDRPDAMEINLSCPNIAGHPPPCYSVDRMREYLVAVRAARRTIAVGIKLAPLFYDRQFVELCALLNAFVDCVRFITAINTVGCGLVVDENTEAPLLAPAGSFGGLGGVGIHPLALGNVRRLVELLDVRIDVIGCGGIDSGAAVFRYVLCGAKAVQIATQLLHEDTVVFARIEAELAALMRKKGYTKLDDFRGKLRTVSDQTRSCAKSPLSKL